jgi:hypothetical protein
VPDLDERHAEQARARDVEPAGDGQLALPEPPPRLPRVVRVAEQHAALAGRGAVRADGDAVAAEPAAAERLADAAGELARRARGRCRARGGRRGEQAVGDRALPAGDRDGVVVAVEVLLGDRPDPGGAAAGRVGDPGPAGAGEVGVEALDVPGDDVADLAPRSQRRRLCGQPVDDAGVVELLEEQVAVQVAPGFGQRRVAAALRAEVLRPLRAHRQVDVRELADVVGRRRETVAVTEAGEVLRDDVRDAVFGVAEDGLAAGLARFRDAGAQRGEGECRSQHRQGFPEWSHLTPLS